MRPSCLQSIMPSVWFYTALPTWGWRKNTYLIHTRRLFQYKIISRWIITLCTFKITQYDKKNVSYISCYLVMHYLNEPDHVASVSIVLHHCPTISQNYIPTQNLNCYTSDISFRPKEACNESSGNCPPLKKCMPPSPPPSQRQCTSKSIKLQPAPNPKFDSSSQH